MSRRLFGRAEGRADLVVAQVVAVPEDDGGTLLRRQVAGQRREIFERRQPVLGGELGQLGLRTPAPRLVDDDPARDREHPGAQMLAVLEPRIGSQGAEERLLEGILGALAAEPPAEEPEDFVAVGFVEGLEGGDHCLLKRTPSRSCEL